MVVAYIFFVILISFISISLKAKGVLLYITFGIQAMIAPIINHLNNKTGILFLLLFSMIDVLMYFKYNETSRKRIKLLNNKIINNSFNGCEIVDEIITCNCFNYSKPYVRRIISYIEILLILFCIGEL